MNHCVLDVLAETQFSEPEGGHVEVTFPSNSNLSSGRLAVVSRL